MSISRWDPFRPMTSLSDAVNQLMSEAVLRPGFQFGGEAPVNVLERPDRYLIQVALPGVKPADIELTCQQSTITIRARRASPFAEMTGQQGSDTERTEFLLTEFGGGEFTRTITLPKTINADQLTTTYEQGVLTITAPIAPEAQPKKITVTTSTPQ
jgi:HSP20 family protein